MTYDEAMEACKSGKFVRNPGMSPGWKLFYDKVSGAFYYLNPHTGSNYLFRPKESHRLKSWELVK